MSNETQRRLLAREEALSLLQLPEDAFEFLVETGQLSELVIRGNKRFDSQDVYRLIDSYKTTTRRRNTTR
jgi:hypothetical protein